MEHEDVAPARAPISDTILDFGKPVLAQVKKPSVEGFKQALDIVITIWNAHVMAMTDWGRPEHLEALLRVADGATDAVKGNFTALSERRALHFASDPRVVSKWDVVVDPLGRLRFDCTARLPDVRRVASERPS